MLRRGSSFGSSERDDFVNEKKRDDHRERGPTTAESVIEWLNKDSSSRSSNQENNKSKKQLGIPIRKVSYKEFIVFFLIGRFRNNVHIGIIYNKSRFLLQRPPL